MENVRIKIGDVVFDHADYDKEHDVLYLHVGDPEVGVGEDTPEGHVIRYSPGTDRIVGLTMMSPRYILRRDGHVRVSLPEAVEKSADDLEPLLVA